MILELSALLRRDLATLAREIALYPDDGSLFQVVPGCPSAGGNLALTGNSVSAGPMGIEALCPGNEPV